MSQRSLRGPFFGKSGHLQYWGRVSTQPLRTLAVVARCREWRHWALICNAPRQV